MSTKVGFGLGAAILFAASSVAAYAAVTSEPAMGPMKMSTRPAFLDYRDGHKTRS